MSKRKYEVGICPLCKVRDNDPSHKRLYKCKKCGRYYCKKHIRQKHTLTPIQIQRIKDPILREKLYKEWRREDAHPCPPYTIELLEKYEKSEVIYPPPPPPPNEGSGDVPPPPPPPEPNEKSKAGIIVAILVAVAILLISIILTLTTNNVSNPSSNLLSFDYLIIDSNSSCSLIISEKVVNKNLPPEKMEEVLNQICSERCEYFNLKGIGYECKSDKLSCKCDKTSYVVSKEFELPLSCAYMTSINVNNDCQKICESRFSGLNLTYSTACKENRIFCICTLDLKYTTQLGWIKKEFEKT